MMREVGVAALAKAEMVTPPLAIPPKNPSEFFARAGSDNMLSSPMTTLFSTLFADNETLTDFKLFSSSLAGISSPPVVFNSGAELTLFNRVNAVDVLPCSGNSTREGVANVQEQSLSNVNAKYKSMMPSRLPIPATSTYLTIPAGLSPTTLLESPVFWNSEPVDSSPTIGSLHSALITELTQTSVDVEIANKKDTIFKQQGSSSSPLHGVVEPQVVCGSPNNTLLLSGQALGFLQNGSKRKNSPESAALSTLPLDVQLSDIATQCISERTAVDGYNWKKYGQKQLKGTEFPRSYYKCTHPNCPVKKQVECSHEGEITEIMYKGEHNHAKPQVLRRGARTAGQSFLPENAVEASGVVNKIELDRLSTELSSSSLVGGLTGTPEQSFGSPSMDAGEDVEQSKSEDDGEDEQDSKRRRTENFRETLANAPIRTIREPRVIVQTTSEIDILDDGYRWRKYGQKVVKGNRFPRSYYKCTNIGCLVRKHVERSSTDPTSVMTAYEGKHNHNVPAARGSVRETPEAMAGPLPTATYAAMGLSSVQRPAMRYETQGLGLVDKGFNGGNRLDVTMANPIVPKMERNGDEVLASSTMLDQGKGLNLSLLKHFAGSGMHGQDLGSTVLQPVYPSSSSTYVVEEHPSR